MDPAALVGAIVHIAQPWTFFMLFIGTLLGIIVRAIPGPSGAMLIALTLPLTFYMQPFDAVVLLVSMYVGAISGGPISATLMRKPGTPALVMTTFDGYPMARGGRPGRALGLGITASFVGGRQQRDRGRRAQSAHRDGHSGVRHRRHPDRRADDPCDPAGADACPDQQRPRAFVLPMVRMFCVIGSYALNNAMFDVWLMPGFGVVGFLLEKARVPLGPFVIGFVLAPLAEEKPRSGLMMTAGDFTPIFTRPFPLAFTLIAVAPLLWPIVGDWRRRRSGS